MWQISRSKKLIDEDVYGVEIRKITPYRGFMLKAYLLQYDTYFRKLFYWRLGAISALIRWYTPGERTFTIACKSIGGGGIFPTHMQQSLMRNL